MNAPALSATGLSVSYSGEAALSDVSFEISPGSLVGVLGPNGAGKTTLLRALLGTVPYRGSVSLSGSAAYVPQLGALETSFPIDALGVVLMGRYPRLGWGRRPGPADRSLARELLDRVGLLERSRDPFGSLSGGQRQRVLIARALAQEGDVLLLDEPLTGIDAPSQETILEVIGQQSAAGRTVCMTTHDLAQAARVCDELLILNRVLAAYGRPGDVFRPEVLSRAYGAELLVFEGGTAVFDEGAHHHH